MHAGQVCTDTTHDASTPHRHLACTVPALVQYQSGSSELMLVQSNQFSVARNLIRCGLKQMLFSCRSLKRSPSPKVSATCVCEYPLCKYISCPKCQMCFLFVWSNPRYKECEEGQMQDGSSFYLVIETLINVWLGK